MITDLFQVIRHACHPAAPQKCTGTWESSASLTPLASDLHNRVLPHAALLLSQTSSPVSLLEMPLPHTCCSECLKRHVPKLHMGLTKELVTWHTSQLHCHCLYIARHLPHPRTHFQSQLESYIHPKAAWGWNKCQSQEWLSSTCLTYCVPLS